MMAQSPITHRDLMLATPGKLFSSPGWIYELKYDGFRCLVSKHGDVVRLESRKGRDMSALFPELVAEVKTRQIRQQPGHSEHSRPQLGAMPAALPHPSTSRMDLTAPSASKHEARLIDGAHDLAVASPPKTSEGPRPSAIQNQRSEAP